MNIKLDFLFCFRDTIMADMVSLGMITIETFDFILEKNFVGIFQFSKNHIVIDKV